MKDIVEKLQREARNLSIICNCDKCLMCKRKNLMWEAALEIEELRKHPESI